MTKELRKLSQGIFRRGKIGLQDNKMCLSISNPHKQVRMRFNNKPDRMIRGDMRLKGFRWSRKMKFWQSRLNTTQIARTKQFMKKLEHIQRQF